MASLTGPEGASRKSRTKSIVGFALKLAVTAACLWYVSRSIAASDLLLLVNTTSLPWVAISVLMIVAQIPLTGLRWCKIVDALSTDGWRTPRRQLLRITAIGIFFGQVAPNLLGEGVRALMLKRLGRSWRESLTSVLIDRAVGLAVLLTIAFCVFLFPSGLTALGGSRIVVVALFGVLLLTGLLALGLAPSYAPILARWRMTSWLGALALASHNVLLRRSSGAYVIAIAVIIHTLAILAVWSLGYAQGFSLSVIDAAALLTVMAGVTVIPITIGGWGLRELVVTALLQAHGVSSERALFFSISFGLVVLLGSTVAAIVWAFYSPEPAES